MRGGATIRTAVALAVAMAGAAGASAQLPTIRIDDVWVVEGSSGTWDQSVTVTLSASSSSTVSVPWSTADGSAIAGQDYVTRTGTVIFPPGVTTQTLSVGIIGDTITNEWIPTTPRDEAFFVQLGTPTNATLLKGRATVTIIDDDRTLPGLQFVSAVADGSAGGGRVRLQWRVPPSTSSGAPTDVRVRWNEGSSCIAPATDTSLPVSGEFLLSNPPLPTLPATVKPAGETQVFEHLGRPFVKHCYALFAIYGASTATTERALVSATPFDAAVPNRVAWAYSTGFPDVVPPTVGEKAIYTVSTDGVVHAMGRGVGGGAWPALWNPVGLGKPAHNRSPVVPLPYGQRLFVGTEVGEVHAVDGEYGAIAWSRSTAFKNTQLSNTPGVQGTPAGVFTSWGGQNDAILVGTSATPSTFYMLNPETGDDITTFSNGSLGGVLGMPVVDYPANRVYFLTTSTAGTLWAFDLGLPGSPGLTPISSPVAYPVGFVGGANSSPVERNGRLYFGLTTGYVYSCRLSDGAGASSPLNLADGQVKGFMFPDRRNTDLYLSTNTAVWGVRDTLDPAAPNLIPRWQVIVPSPSTALHWPNTNYLYVGSGNGCLYQVDVSVANPLSTKRSVLLESGNWIGAPSLDGPNGLVLVGSGTGVVYAVRVPLTVEVDCP
jgi:Calx-beta domain/PQQ-like domain